MDPQETQISFKLNYALAFLLATIGISSYISYKVGRGTAYREIIEMCITHRVSAALCFLASEEAMRELEMMECQKR